MKHSLNITKLVHAIAQIKEDSAEIQALFLAGGEINEDPHNAFALLTPPSGLQVRPKVNSDSIYQAFVGLTWINPEEDDRLEIADIVVEFDAETNMLTSAGCCGVSFTQDEWNEMNK